MGAALAKYEIRQERRAFRAVRNLQTADGAAEAKRQMDAATAKQARRNFKRALAK